MKTFDLVQFPLSPIITTLSISIYKLFITSVITLFFCMQTHTVIIIFLIEYGTIIQQYDVFDVWTVTYGTTQTDPSEQTSLHSCLFTVPYNSVTHQW